MSKTDRDINDAALRWCAEHQYDTSKDRGIAFKDGAYWLKEQYDKELKKINSEYAWLIRHSWMCSAISKAKAAELLGCSLIDFDNVMNNAVLKED